MYSSSKLKGCFLHQSDEWKTPLDFFNIYVRDADFDPCPGHGEYKLPIKDRNYDHDGLSIPWRGIRVFVNPPYSNIGAWVDKCIEEVTAGHCAIIELLVPSRTDTKWFQKLWANRDNAYGLRCWFNFIPGRIHFNNSKNGAPFPSVMISISYARFKPLC